MSEEEQSKLLIAFTRQYDEKHFDPIIQDELDKIWGARDEIMFERMEKEIELEFKAKIASLRRVNAKKLVEVLEPVDIEATE